VKSAITQEYGLDSKKLLGESEQGAEGEEEGGFFYHIQRSGNEPGRFLMACQLD